MRNTAVIRVLSTYQENRSRKVNRVDRLAKRCLDILASSLGLIFLSPLFAFIAWRIQRDSPGPVFYHGKRVGKGGKTFDIVKFRTMREEPQSHLGPRVTAQDDPRVTPFGRWLRDSKLNELPQLWNVLKGEMSLVGPRPEDPLLANSWPRDAWKEITSVRPGITSPASVLYRDEESLLNGKQMMDTYLGEILPSKLRLDQLYVRYRTFWGDLDIIFWTFLSLAPVMRHKDVSEPSLFVGPLARLMHRHVRWFIIDILVTMTAIAIAGLFWRSTGPLNVGWEAAVVLAFTFAALFSVTNVLLKINLIEWSRAAASDAFDLIPGIAISLCAALAINHMLPAQWIGIPVSDAVTPSVFAFWGTRSLLPNGMLIFAGGLAAIGFIVARYRSRLITGLATRWVDWRGVGGRGLERVLIIGGGDSGQFAAWMLQNGKYSLSLHVVGFVDDSLSMQDTRIHGLNVLGRREDIPDLVKELDIGILVFAIHNVTKQERHQLMDICQKTSARIFDFPDIPGEIQQISRSNGSHNGSKTVVHNQQPSEYQHISDPYLTPGYFDSLLAQLEQTVQSGDTSKTLAEIEKIRRKINNENSAIQTAHISTAD